MRDKGVKVNTDGLILDESSASINILRLVCLALLDQSRCYCQLPARKESEFVAIDRIDNCQLLVCKFRWISWWQLEVCLVPGYQLPMRTIYSCWNLQWYCEISCRRSIPDGTRNGSKKFNRQLGRKVYSCGNGQLYWKPFGTWRLNWQLATGSQLQGHLSFITGWHAHGHTVLSPVCLLLCVPVCRPVYVYTYCLPDRPPPLQSALPWLWPWDTCWLKPETCLFSNTSSDIISPKVKCLWPVANGHSRGCSASTIKCC